jgi:hypothetical protein
MPIVDAAARACHHRHRTICSTRIYAIFSCCCDVHHLRTKKTATRGEEARAVGAHTTTYATDGCSELKQSQR